MQMKPWMAKRITVRGSFHAVDSFALTLLLLLICGCTSSPKKKIDDPFAAQSHVSHPVARSSTSSSVSQAGFEQAAPQPEVSLSNKSYPDDDEKSFSKSVSKFSPKKMWDGTKSAFGLGPDEAKARKYYAEGESLFREKQYDKAASKFKTAAWRWPDSMLQEDAMFMRAESYFFADRYSKASDTYGTLAKKYENSRHLDKLVQRHFAIARYWEQRAKDTSWIMPNFFDKTRTWFDPQGNAIAVYESIRLNDPTGPLADDATMATANAYFLSRRYEDAAYHYDLIRKEYPQSDHQQQAHLLGLQSKIRSYQGPQYDAQPLEDADELVDQTLVQFGRQIEGERENLLKAKRKIREERAQREYATAEYYRRTGYNAAARYYYDAILKEFSDTQLAGESRKRIEEIKDLPAVPPDYFPWLTKVFGRRQQLLK